MDKMYSEYYLLTEKLDEINWALDGSCNDIDCDKYMYRNLLKKKYKPVLEHNFSCMKKLRSEKDALMRLLSLKRFRRFRYKKCPVCKKRLDKLSEKSIIAAFTRPSEFKGQKASEWDGKWVHRKCKRKVKTPKGWKSCDKC